MIFAMRISQREYIGGKNSLWKATVEKFIAEKFTTERFDTEPAEKIYGMALSLFRVILSTQFLTRRLYTASSFAGIENLRKNCLLIACK